MWLHHIRCCCCQVWEQDREGVVLPSSSHTSQTSQDTSLQERETMDLYT